MIEAGWQDLVDQLWVVEIDRDEAVRRLMTRNGFTFDEAKQRVNAQIKNEDRRKYASVVIANDGDLVKLRSQCEQLWKELTPTK